MKDIDAVCELAPATPATEIMLAIVVGEAVALVVVEVILDGVEECSVDCVALTDFAAVLVIVLDGVEDADDVADAVAVVIT